MKHVKSAYWKFGLGFVILAFIISKIDLKSSQTVFNQVSLNNFLAVLCIYLLGQTLSSYKWSVISEHIGFTCTFSQYLRLYFQGIFYNQFLPGGIGGDVIKGYFLYQHDKSHLKPDYAAAAILFDRISGVLVLLMLLLTGDILYFRQLPALTHWILLGSIGLISACIILTAYLSYQRIMFKHKLINRILFLVRLYSDKTIFKIFALSIMFHLMLIAIHVIIGLDLNLKIAWLFYLVAYPSAAILASLPISPNGLGIREWSYIFFLGLAGITSSEAFIFALYWGMILLAASLIGGIFLISWNKNEMLKS